MSYIYKSLMNYLPFKNGSDLDESNKKLSKDRTKKWLGKYESYSVFIQSLLIWEDPIKSSIALILTNVIYWFIVMSGCSLISLGSSVCLIAFLYHQWVDVIWPEIRVPPQHQEDSEEWTPLHPDVMSAPEMATMIDNVRPNLENLGAELLELRKRQKTLFCLLSVGLFSLMAYMGTFVSDALLCYLAFMIIWCWFALKKLTRMIPPEYRYRPNLNLSGNMYLHGDVNTFLSEFFPEEGSLEAQAALHVPLISQDPPLLEERDEAQALQPRALAEDTNTNTRRRRENRRVEALDVEEPISLEDSNTNYFTHGLPEDFPSIENDSDLEIDIPEGMPSITQDSLTYDTRDSLIPQSIEFAPRHFASSDEEGGEGDDILQTLLRVGAVRQEAQAAVTRRLVDMMSMNAVGDASATLLDGLSSYLYPQNTQSPQNTQQSGLPQQPRIYAEDYTEEEEGGYEESETDDSFEVINEDEFRT